MGKERSICAIGMLAFALTITNPPSAMSLVFPGAPEHERAEPERRASPDKREVRLFYPSVTEPVRDGREIRLSYSGNGTRANGKRPRLRSLRDVLRSKRRAQKSDASQSASWTISYRNGPNQRSRRHGRVSLRIPGRSYERTGSHATASRPSGLRPSGMKYGTASWYGWEFHGRRTANGETYNMYEHTAAHRTLPFGTRIRVTNLRNGRQAVVRINDRGPFIKGREIDLSYATARELDMLESGIEEVRLDILSG